MNNLSSTVIRTVTLSRLHTLIVVVTVIHIVFVLAAAAVVVTLVIVVVIPVSRVIPLAPPVPGLKIKQPMSTGGWCLGFVLACSLILASLQHLEIQTIFARVTEHPHPDVIVCI